MFNVQENCPKSYSINEVAIYPVKEIKEQSSFNMEGNNPKSKHSRKEIDTIVL